MDATLRANIECLAWCSLGSSPPSGKAPVRPSALRLPPQKTISSASPPSPALKASALKAAAAIPHALLLSTADSTQWPDILHPALLSLAHAASSPDPSLRLSGMEALCTLSESLSLTPSSSTALSTTTTSLISSSPSRLPLRARVALYSTLATAASIPFAAPPDPAASSLLLTLSLQLFSETHAAATAPPLSHSKTNNNNNNNNAAGTTTTITPPSIAVVCLDSIASAIGPLAAAHGAHWSPQKLTDAFSTLASSLPRAGASPGVKLPLQNTFSSLVTSLASCGPQVHSPAVAAAARTLIAVLSSASISPWAHGPSAEEVLSAPGATSPTSSSASEGALWSGILSIVGSLFKHTPTASAFNTPATVAFWTMALAPLTQVVHQGSNDIPMAPPELRMIPSVTITALSTLSSLLSVRGDELSPTQVSTTLAVLHPLLHPPPASPSGRMDVKEKMVPVKVAALHALASLATVSPFSVVRHVVLSFPQHGTDPAAALDEYLAPLSDPKCDPALRSACLEVRGTLAGALARSPDLTSAVVSLGTGSSEDALALAPFLSTLFSSLVSSVDPSEPSPNIRRAALVALRSGLDDSSCALAPVRIALTPGASAFLNAMGDSAWPVTVAAIHGLGVVPWTALVEDAGSSPPPALAQASELQQAALDALFSAAASRDRRVSAAAIQALAKAAPAMSTTPSPIPRLEFSPGRSGSFPSGPWVASLLAIARSPIGVVSLPLAEVSGVKGKLLVSSSGADGTLEAVWSTMAAAAAAGVDMSAWFGDIVPLALGTATSTPRLSLSGHLALIRLFRLLSAGGPRASDFFPMFSDILAHVSAVLTVLAGAHQATANPARLGGVFADAAPSTASTLTGPTSPPSHTSQVAYQALAAAADATAVAAVSSRAQAALRPSSALDTSAIDAAATLHELRVECLALLGVLASCGGRMIVPLSSDLIRLIGAHWLHAPAHAVQATNNLFKAVFSSSSSSSSAPPESSLASGKQPGSTLTPHVTSLPSPSSVWPASPKNEPSGGVGASSRPGPLAATAALIRPAFSWPVSSLFSVWGGQSGAGHSSGDTDRGGDTSAATGGFSVKSPTERQIQLPASPPTPPLFSPQLSENSLTSTTPGTHETSLGSRPTSPGQELPDPSLAPPVLSFPIAAGPSGSEADLLALKSLPPLLTSAWTSEASSSLWTTLWKLHSWNVPRAAPPLPVPPLSGSVAPLVWPSDPSVALALAETFWEAGGVSSFPMSLHKELIAQFVPSVSAAMATLCSGPPAGPEFSASVYEFLATMVSMKVDYSRLDRSGSFLRRALDLAADGAANVSGKVLPHLFLFLAVVASRTGPSVGPIDVLALTSSAVDKLSGATEPGVGAGSWNEALTVSVASFASLAEPPSSPPSATTKHFTNGSNSPLAHTASDVARALLAVVGTCSGSGALTELNQLPPRREVRTWVARVLSPASVKRLGSVPLLNFAALAARSSVENRRVVLSALLHPGVDWGLLDRSSPLEHSQDTLAALHGAWSAVKVHEPADVALVLDAAANSAEDLLGAAASDGIHGVLAIPDTIERLLVALSGLAHIPPQALEGGWLEDEARSDGTSEPLGWFRTVLAVVEAVAGAASVTGKPGNPSSTAYALLLALVRAAAAHETLSRALMTSPVSTKAGDSVEPEDDGGDDDDDEGEGAGEGRQGVDHRRAIPAGSPSPDPIHNCLERLFTLAIGPYSAPPSQAQSDPRYLVASAVAVAASIVGQPQVGPTPELPPAPAPPSADFPALPLLVCHLFALRGVDAPSSWESTALDVGTGLDERSWNRPTTSGGWIRAGALLSWAESVLAHPERVQRLRLSSSMAQALVRSVAEPPVHRLLFRVTRPRPDPFDSGFGRAKASSASGQFVGIVQGNIRQVLSAAQGLLSESGSEKRSMSLAVHALSVVALLPPCVAVWKWLVSVLSQESGVLMGAVVVAADAVLRTGLSSALDQAPSGAEAVKKRQAVLRGLLESWKVSSPMTRMLPSWKILSAAVGREKAVRQFIGTGRPRWMMLSDEDLSHVYRVVAKDWSEDDHAARTSELRTLLSKVVCRRLEYWRRPGLLIRSLPADDAGRMLESGNEALSWSVLAAVIRSPDSGSKLSKMAAKVAVDKIQGKSVFRVDDVTEAIAECAAVDAVVRDHASMLGLAGGLRWMTQGARDVGSAGGRVVGAVASTAVGICRGFGLDDVVKSMGRGEDAGDWVEFLDELEKLLMTEGAPRSPELDVKGWAAVWTKGSEQNVPPGSHGSALPAIPDELQSIRGEGVVLKEGEVDGSVDVRLRRLVGIAGSMSWFLFPSAASASKSVCASATWSPDVVHSVMELVATVASASFGSLLPQTWAHVPRSPEQASSSVGLSLRGLNGLLGVSGLSHANHFLDVLSAMAPLLVPSPHRSTLGVVLSTTPTAPPERVPEFGGGADVSVEWVSEALSSVVGGSGEDAVIGELTRVVLTLATLALRGGNPLIPMSASMEPLVESIGRRSGSAAGFADSERGVRLGAVLAAVEGAESRIEGKDARGVGWARALRSDRSSAAIGRLPVSALRGGAGRRGLWGSVAVEAVVSTVVNQVLVPLVSGERLRARAEASRALAVLADALNAVDARTVATATAAQLKSQEVLSDPVTRSHLLVACAKAVALSGGADTAALSAIRAAVGSALSEGDGWAGAVRGDEGWSGSAQSVALAGLHSLLYLLDAGLTEGAPALLSTAFSVLSSELGNLRAPGSGAVRNAVVDVSVALLAVHPSAASAAKFSGTVVSSLAALATDATVPSSGRAHVLSGLATVLLSGALRTSSGLAAAVLKLAEAPIPLDHAALALARLRFVLTALYAGGKASGAVKGSAGTVVGLGGAFSSVAAVSGSTAIAAAVGSRKTPEKMGGPSALDVVGSGTQTPPRRRTALEWLRGSAEKDKKKSDGGGVISRVSSRVSLGGSRSNGGGGGGGDGGNGTSEVTVDVGLVVRGLFARLRMGATADGTVIATVLPQLLLDFFQPGDVVDLVVGEFLSVDPVVGEAVLLYRVLFDVFSAVRSVSGSGDSEGNRKALEWALTVMTSFVHAKDASLAVWALTGLFLSMSRSPALRALYGEVLGDDGMRADEEVFGIAAADFLFHSGLDGAGQSFVLSKMEVEGAPKVFGRFAVWARGRFPDSPSARMVERRDIEGE